MLSTMKSVTKPAIVASVASSVLFAIASLTTGAATFNIIRAANIIPIAHSAKFAKPNTSERFS